MKTPVNPSKGYSCAMRIARIGVVFYMLCMVGTANAYNWKGSKPIPGEKYYLYTKNQNKFLNDNNGLDDYNKNNTQWTMGGTFPSPYTLTSTTSTNGKQLAMYREWEYTKYHYYLVTNATGKSGNDIKFASELDNNGYYSIYRANKWSAPSDDRNIASTTNGIQRIPDASHE